MEESTLLQNQSLDFSFIALFLKATITVKLVMLVLIFSSIWSWAIIIQKIIDYRKSKRETKIFLDEFWSGGSLKNCIMKKEMTLRVFVNRFSVRQWMSGKDRQMVMEN